MALALSVAEYRCHEAGESYVASVPVSHEVWAALSETGVITHDTLAYMVQGEMDAHLWHHPNEWYVKAIKVRPVEGHTYDVGPHSWLLGEQGGAVPGILAAETAPLDAIGLILSVEGWSTATDRGPIRVHIATGLLFDGTAVEATQHEGQEAVYTDQPTTPELTNLLANVLDRAGAWGVHEASASTPSGDSATDELPPRRMLLAVSSAELRDTFLLSEDGDLWWRSTSEEDGDEEVAALDEEAWSAVPGWDRQLVTPLVSAFAEALERAAFSDDASRAEDCCVTLGRIDEEWLERLLRHWGRRCLFYLDGAYVGFDGRFLLDGRLVDGENELIDSLDHVIDSFSASWESGGPATWEYHEAVGRSRLHYVFVAESEGEHHLEVLEHCYSAEHAVAAAAEFSQRDFYGDSEERQEDD